MILKLYKKDLSVLFSDKKVLLLFVVMPIVLTTILSFALKGSFSDGHAILPVQVGIVKAYDGQAERDKFFDQFGTYANAADLQIQADFSGEIPDFEALFWENFLGNPDLKSILTVREMTDDAAQTALHDGDVAAVVYLPEHFIFDQYVNFYTPFRNQIEVEVQRGSDFTYSGQVVTDIFESYFDVLNTQIIGKNVYLEVASPYLDSETLYSGIEAIYAASNEVRSDAAREPQLVFETVPGKRQVNSFTYYAIAMMGMFVLYASGHTGRELLREKQNLTLDRASASGVGYIHVLLSKFLMTATLCALQMTVLLLFSKLVLGVDWLHVGGIATGIGATSLAVSGIGIFLSALTLTQDNYRVTSIFETVLIHIFALFGGSYIPLDALPEIFSKLKFIAPNRLVIDLFLKIYQGEAFMALSNDLMGLLLISILFSGMGIVIVKRKEATDYVGRVKA